MSKMKKILQKEVEGFEELAHAYYEPGDKDYWNAIEFAKGLIDDSNKRVARAVLEEIRNNSVARLHPEYPKMIAIPEKKMQTLLEDLK